MKLFDNTIQYTEQDNITVKKIYNDLNKRIDNPIYGKHVLINKKEYKELLNVNYFIKHNNKFINDYLIKPHSKLDLKERKKLLKKCEFLEKKYFDINDPDLYSRQLVIHNESMDDNSLPSCISTFQFIIRNNCLNLFVFVRSQHLINNFLYDNQTYMLMLKKFYDLYNQKSKKSIIHKQIDVGEISVHITSLHKGINN